ncbi:MAG TPA: DUF3108 domain-containing protein [Hyphomicrobium sp.]|jgi:hypothetical protein|nr:DUF3108 domain-containing protein [Hyphomicrobium sp.]
MLTSKGGARRRLLAFGLFALGTAAIAATLAPAVAREQSWPTEVKARYRLTFNGFEVGSYNFSSHYSGTTYSATGKTKISALFGAFKWTGTFTGSGSVDGTGPHPAAYKMSYKKGSKVASVTMGFNAGDVKSIALVPNKPPHPDAIKVKPDNLKHVFDPISATLAISDATGADACNRTIPVFDGKARFDLKLSLKRREAIAEKHPTGQPRELLVCRVKYIPIAGHKPKDFVKPWIDYDHIEIALRAIPSAGIYVPYRVSVPSTIGPAMMTAEEIHITAPNNVQIALKQ